MMSLIWVAAGALCFIPGEASVAREVAVTVVVHPPSRDECLSLRRDHDCFGDSIVHLDLDVHGRVGLSVDLVGQLFQLTAELAVPTGEPMKIVGARLFDDTARFHISVPVRLPAVKRLSRFDYRIRSRTVAEPVWQSMGHIVFEVHPRGIMDELAHLGKTRLFILDDHDRRLISFFEEEEIPFSVLSSLAMSELPQVSVVNRTASASMYAEDRLVLRVISSVTETRRVAQSDPILDELLRKGFRVIQFREKVATLPVVIIRQVAPGVRVDVEMPLFNALADSPRAQLFIMNVIRLSLDGAQH